MKTMNAMGLCAVLALATAGCSVATGIDGEDVEAVASALTTTYQAESAFDVDEGVFETLHAGYTGTGYINIDNAVGTFIWYVVNTSGAGPAQIAVRYANGTSGNRPIQVEVNGSPVAVIPGAPTGAWTNWSTATVSATLAAGNNDVFLRSTTATGMPNIDKIDVAQNLQTYQAEAAFDIDEGVVETIHAGYTGTGYVNIDNFSNTFMWHIVNSPVTTSATLTVRYANGTASNRPIRVEGAGTIPGVPTGSWSTWATASIAVNLTAGDNDVVLSSVTADGMPNIDRFDIVR